MTPSDVATFIYTISTVVNPDAPTIAVSSPTARVGESVNVILSLSNNPGFAGMSLRIAFPEELTLIRYELGNSQLVGGFTGPDGVDPGDAANISGNFVVNWGRTSNFTQNGQLLILTFAIAPNAKDGSYPITVSFEGRTGIDIPTNLNGEELDFSIIPGAVGLTSITYGDVNGDGRVNTADLVLLARYLAEHPVTLAVPAAGDVNGDGRINTADLVLLARYLAEHNVYLGPRIR